MSWILDNQRVACYTGNWPQQLCLLEAYHAGECARRRRRQEVPRFLQPPLLQLRLDEPPHKWPWRLASALPPPAGDDVSSRPDVVGSRGQQTDRTVGSTGRPRCSAVRPGVTPPTIWVPQAMDSLAFA